MRYIAVLLTATLSLSCAANAGGIWGEPADIAPIQTTGSSNDPLVGQANVTRPPAASSSKTQANVTRPPAASSSKTQANVTRPPAASSSKTQANVTRPPAASSSKTNGLASGTVPGPSTGPVSGPRTVHASNAFTSAATVDGGYDIGPSDVLDISVFQVPELTKSVQVAESGTVNLPLVGEIPVAGRSAQEVERDLTSRLGTKYVNNPQVTVYVKEYNSRRVTITGAIKKPGVYPIKGRTSLLQVVAIAGGLDDVSDSTVLVLSQTNGKRSAATYNVSAIQNGQAEDPPLQPGDQLLAGTSAIKSGFNTILKSLPLAGTARGAVGGQ
jgi:polysaccharide biosynthesis/export protein